MSKHHHETITCPQCGEESDFLCWDSINTVLDPDMKEKVRTGEVFRWKCPACGNEATVDHACLYHQMDDNVMIYYVPGDPTDAIGFLQKDSDLFPGMMSDYTRRVVQTRNQFREKLLILDAALDDRVIELMKPIMIAGLQSNDPALQVLEIRFAVQPDGTYCFAVRIGEDQWGHTVFFRDMYDHAAQSFREKLDADSNVVIDFDWAMSIIRSE